MESHVIEKISNPIQEISLPKHQSACPDTHIKGRVVRTKVVGVTFENRQEVISRLHKGDRIWIDPEPDNPYDVNAISVCCSNGEQIGYINRHLAASVIHYFQAYGYPVKGKVTAITGSDWGGYSLGVVIAFKLPKRHQSKTTLRFEDWDDWDL